MYMIPPVEMLTLSLCNRQFNFRKVAKRELSLLNVAFVDNHGFYLKVVWLVDALLWLYIDQRYIESMHFSWRPHRNIQNSAVVSKKEPHDLNRSLEFFFTTHLSLTWIEEFYVNLRRFPRSQTSCHDKTQMFATNERSTTVY